LEPYEGPTGGQNAGDNGYYLFFQRTAPTIPLFTVMGVWCMDGLAKRQCFLLTSNALRREVLGNYESDNVISQRIGLQ
jgi:hypothetical protein